MTTRKLTKLPSELAKRGWKQAPSVFGFAPYFWCKRQYDKHRGAWIAKRANGAWYLTIDSNL
jgi:hypothetical protein